MDYLNKAYLLIGGNVGNKFAYLHQAVMLIQKQCGVIASRSSVYETAPWGNTQQDSFLNQALELNTNYKPLELMKALLAIEALIGRVREEKYGPRIIDLDMLLFNNEIYSSDQLTIPHKEMQNRRFVLQPLCEIAALLVHPVLNKTVKQLLDDCTDMSEVKAVVDENN